MTHYLFAQRGHVHVRIYLCSGYVFVSEHLLDGSQAGSSLQQGCGEGVAQGVWRDCLLDARVSCRVLYHYQYHGAREVCSASVQKHILLFTGLDVHDVTVVHPVFYFLQGVVRDGDEAFLATLADDAQTMFLLEDVGEAQRHEFADAQTAGEERLYDGAVSLSFPFGEVDGGLHAVHFLHAQHFRKMHAT